MLFFFNPTWNFFIHANLFSLRFASFLAVYFLAPCHTCHLFQCEYIKRTKAKTLKNSWFVWRICTQPSKKKKNNKKMWKWLCAAHVTSLPFILLSFFVFDITIAIMLPARMSNWVDFFREWLRILVEEWKTMIDGRLEIFDEKEWIFGED